MPTELTIIFEQVEDGWWLATIPEIPGASSQGQTKEEARDMVLDAVQELMAARRELALRERSESAQVEAFSLAS